MSQLQVACFVCRQVACKQEPRSDVELDIEDDETSVYGRSQYVLCPFVSINTYEYDTY